MLVKKNDEEFRQKDMAKKSNDQLFSVNAKKNDSKRDKLKKDRFRDMKRITVSQTDYKLVKRLREKE